MKYDSYQPQPSWDLQCWLTVCPPLIFCCDLTSIYCILLGFFTHPETAPSYMGQCHCYVLSLAGPSNSTYTECIFSETIPTTAFLSLPSVGQWLSSSLTVPPDHVVAYSSPVQGIYLFSVPLEERTSWLEVRCCNVSILPEGNAFCSLIQLSGGERTKITGSQD